MVRLGWHRCRQEEVASISFVALITLATLVTISIGLINLFPIPASTVGTSVIMDSEPVLGRPLRRAAQDVGFRLGLTSILGLK